MPFAQLILSAPDRQKAREVANLLTHSAPAQLQIAAAGDAPPVSLPASIVAALRDCLTALGEGEGVLLLDEGTELSPEQAGQILGISRPLVYLRMDNGRLPFRTIGSHRRLRLSDVLALVPFEEATKAAAKAIGEDTDDFIVNYASASENMS